MVPCMVVISSLWAFELTSTAHSGTERALTPPVALQTSVSGESELAAAKAEVSLSTIRSSAVQR